jgi:hypothetical protein
LHNRLWVNTSICKELLWTADRLEHSDGVHILKSRFWSPAEAHITFFMDTCLSGIAFWSPDLNVGFQSAQLSTYPNDILFLESLAILSALQHSSHCALPQPTCILVYMDSLNSVSLFSSLHTQPSFNSLLITASGLQLHTNISLHVSHIPGKANIIADALSRFKNSVALVHIPNLLILPFCPPLLSLGADVS